MICFALFADWLGKIALVAGLLFNTFESLLAHFEIDWLSKIAFTTFGTLPFAHVAIELLENCHPSNSTLFR